MRKNKVGRRFTTGCGMVGKASGRWLTGVNRKGLERVVLRGSVNHGFTAGYGLRARESKTYEGYPQSKLIYFENLSYIILSDVT